MTDATEVTPVPEPTKPASDETLNTENGHETTVTYDRFKQANDRMKAAEKKLKELEDAETARQAQAKKDEEQKQIEAGEFEKVLAELRPKAERLKTLEAFMQKRFEAALATVPEEFRKLIPPGDIETVWAWLDEAQTAGLFTKTPAPDIAAGTRGERGLPPVDPSKILPRRSY